jgi:hypothetical protein
MQYFDAIRSLFVGTVRKFPTNGDCDASAKIRIGAPSHLAALRSPAKKFNDPAAIGANQVIVMLVIVMMLVISFIISEAHFAGEPGFSQKFESAVNGRVPDRRVLLLHQPVKVFARQMLFGAQENLQIRSRCAVRRKPAF